MKHINNLARRLLLGVAAALALGGSFSAMPASAASNNLLVNGSFDGPTAGTLEGWTLIRDCPDNYHLSSYNIINSGFYVPTYAGTSSYWLNDACDPSQALAVTVGTTYLVSGVIRLGSGYECDHPRTFDCFFVSLDDSYLPLTFGTPDVNGWVRFSSSFTAATDSVVITFMGSVHSSGSGYQDCDYVVDDLAVSPPDVPSKAPQISLDAVDHSHETPLGSAFAGDVRPGSKFPASATFGLLTQPQHGKVLWQGDGRYTYSPDAGFSGADEFTYIICGGGRCDAAVERFAVTSMGAIRMLPNTGVGADLGSWALGLGSLIGGITLLSSRRVR